MRALDALVVSVIARVEVPAALWRKERTGELSSADATLLVLAFEADYLGAGDEPPLFAAVALLAPVLERAAELTGSHGLRAYDAVQLASALSAREADPGCTSFACFDADLRTAAARSGLALVPTMAGS
jgi:predicted nucleic acid-binding protein